MFLISESGHYAFTIYRANALGYVFVKSHSSLKTDVIVETLEDGMRFKIGEHYIYAADEVDNKIRLGTPEDYDSSVFSSTMVNKKYGQYLCVDTSINHLVLGNENLVSLC